MVKIDFGFFISYNKYINRKKVDRVGNTVIEQGCRD